MLTGKQRSYLRGLGNNLDVIFQIGKNGIEDAFIIQVQQALEKRELIKIKVLENSGLDTREASDIICKKVGCEGVSAVGSKMVLYKESENHKTIEIPEKGRKK